MEDDDALPGEIIDDALLTQLSHHLAETHTVKVLASGSDQKKPAAKKPRKKLEQPSFKTKMTAPIKKKILDCLKIGANVEDCARAAGVSSRTIRRMRHRDPQFFKKMASARADAKIVLLDKLYKQIEKGDGDLALKALSRRFPEWSSKKDVKHSGEIRHKHRHKGRINVVQDVIAEFRKLSPEEFEEAARSRIENRNPGDVSG